MNQKIFSNEMQVEEVCKKLRPILGKKIDLIFLNYKMTDDKEKRFEIEQALNALYLKYLNSSLLNDKILLEPPQKDIIGGDFLIGMVAYAEKELYPFGLRDRDMPRHICITGMSGSGKTNMGFQILRTLIAKQKKFMVFDWKKSFRPLSLIDNNLLIFTIGNENISNHFKININRPPKGVAPKEWISILADIINESFFASHGVHKIISEVLDDTFKEFGVYEGSDNYPNWLDIKQRLEEKESENIRGRESEWLTSALRIAHCLTFGGFGECLNANDVFGINVDELLNQKVIFELDSLGSAEKKFFCEYILTYIYKLYKVKSITTNEFKYAIIVDEAHNIFLKEKPVFLKESITEAIYREIREYGVSLICMDQHISKLSDVVPGNSACNIAFQQMLPQDIQTISGVMQMWETRNQFSMLPTGTAIVRLAERYHKPFLVSVPFIQIMKENVPDKEIFLRMSGFMRDYNLRKIIEESKEENAKKVFKQKENMVKEIFHASCVNTDYGVEGYPEQKEILVEEDPVKVHDEIEKTDKSYLFKPNNKMNNVDRLSTTHQKTFDRMKSIEEKYENAKQRFLQEIEEKKKQELETLEKTPIYKLEENKTKPFENSYSHINTKIQLQFCRAVQLNPLLSVSQIYKHLNLSARKGNKLKDELVQNGMIEVVEYRTNKGWKKFLKLSTPCQAMLSQNGLLIKN